MPTTNPARAGHDGGADGYDGNGRNGGNGHGPPKREWSTAKIGMWLFAASLAAIFASLAGAYAYRLSDKPNYYFPWPPSLWISTVAIVLSTLSLYLAQRAAKIGNMNACIWRLRITLALGWIFVSSQFLAWLLLRDAGFYAASNPIAALFYVLTTVHAFHMLLGVGWLIYLFFLAKQHQLTAKRHLALELFAIYWHLMTIVWLVFFGLIVI